MINQEERRIANRRQAERRSGQGAIDIYKCEVGLTVQEIHGSKEYWCGNALTFVTVAVAVIWVRMHLDCHPKIRNWRIVNRFTDEVVQTKEKWLIEKNREKT